MSIGKISIVQSMGIESQTAAQALTKMGRSDKAKARRAEVVSETFQYGEKNYRDPDFLFATVTHAQAMEWLEVVAAAGPELIGEWGETFVANCRERVSDAEAMGQTESVFTGKMLVMMNILMEKVNKRVTKSMLEHMKGDEPDE